MSAGHSGRGGYLVTSVHTRRSTHEATDGERVTMILAGAVVMMVVALGTNEVVAAAAGRFLGAAWSEIARFVLHVLSGGAV